MNLTNDFAEKTLKEIRSFEAGNKDEKELAETLANIKVIQEELEEAEGKIKKTFKEKYSGEIYFFLDTQKKVYLAEGRKSTDIDSEEVYNKLKDIKLAHYFPKISNIVIQKLNLLSTTEDLIKIKEIIDKCSFKKQGDSYITILKMSKQELIEHSK